MKGINPHSLVYFALRYLTDNRMRFSTLFALAALDHLTLVGAFSTGRLKRRDEGPGPDCSLGTPPTNAPHKNFWGSLTSKETADVLSFLHRNETGFNLTSAEDAGRYVLDAVL